MAPLRFASLLGVLLALAALLFGLTILWEIWTTGKQVPGYPSLMIGLMTIGGVQLIMIGIVGEYIGKILSELKARPIYFVAEHSEKRAEGETRGERRRTDRRRMNDARAAPDLAVRRRLRDLAEGVNRAIRDLIARGRLNATSVMVVGAGDRTRRGRRACRTLQRGSPRCAIGLHVTLTAPFRPLTMHFRPTRRRHVPAVSDDAAIAGCCGGSIPK